ncbi:MAG: phosphatidylserine/phosphatidylglycerophosphate/cardiolipin synthase family protein [Planctomycetota bacterium]
MSRSHSASSVLSSFLVPSRAHRCIPLSEGLSAFDCRKRLIRQSQRRIWISTFLWRNDRVGNFLLDELERRSREGVEVRILLDHWVTLQSENSILPRLRQLAVSTGIEVRLFNPVVQKMDPADGEIMLAGAKYGETLNRRMHGKMMLFDEACVIVGGRNLGDEYFDMHRFRCFSDAEVLISGPIVEETQTAYARFWDHDLSVDLLEFADEEQPTTAKSGTPSDSVDLPAPFSKIAEECCPDYTAHIYTPRQMELYYDLPAVDCQTPDETGNRLVEILTSARKSIHLTSPIIIFPDSWLDRLAKLREQNGSFLLSIVTNSLVSTDNLYTYAAGLKQRKTLLNQLHAHLHEIRAVPEEIARMIPSYARLSEENDKSDAQPESGFGANHFECDEFHTTLHCKYFILDGTTTLLGSPNLDPRSLFVNTELLLRIEDESLSQYFLEHHNRFRLNTNSWVVARRQKETITARVSRLLPSQQSREENIDTSRPGYCFAPRKKTPQEIPDPWADDFYDRYESCGVYPGVKDSEEKVELFFTEKLSHMFRDLL